MTNVHACLVHEAPDCVRDLVANLRHLDPESTVLLYDGSANQALLRAGVLRGEDGVLVHPHPRPMRWGALHDFAFDALRFALDRTDFSTLTVVDSDQLALRRGYAGFLATALADRPRAGCLVGTNGGLQPPQTRVGPALAAWREIDRWRPFFRRFPDGESLFPHWGFWPAMVITRPAALSLLELANDPQLRDLLAGTRVWATEEVVLPTLVALTGHEVLPNPAATDYVRYRVQFTPAQLDHALTRPDVYWMHPVPRRMADPLRDRIRRHHGDYLDAPADTPGTVSPPPAPSPSEPPSGPALLRALPLLDRLPTLPGRLARADGDLLLGAAVDALRRGPGPHVILAVGPPCPRRDLVLDTAMAAIDPAATRTTTTGPADLVVLDADGLADAAADWTDVECRLSPGTLVAGLGGGHLLADLLVDLFLAEPLARESGSSVVRFRQPLAAPPLRPLLASSAGVQGWLDADEAVLLAAAATRALAAVPGGAVVEIGSYRGRGTVVLGGVAVARGARRVVAVDTFDGTVGASGQLRRGPPTYDSFRHTLHDAGLDDAVEIVRGRAPELPWTEPVAFALIDGLHDHASALADATHFAPFVPPGGVLAFHDYADHWPGVRTAVAEVLRSGGWRRTAQVGTMLVLQRVAPAGPRPNSAVRVPRPAAVPPVTASALPLVSCIMPTHGRPEFVPGAVERFLRQDYEERELLVVDDGPRPVGHLLPDEPRVRHVRLEGRNSVGAKRNAACARAHGELVLNWDDDDWYAPWRIRYQVEEFLRSDADVAGLATLLYWDPAAGLAWRYRYPPIGRPWVHDPTFCYRRSYWERHPFPNTSHSLDTTWLWRGAAPRRVLVHEHSGFYVGIVHPGNTSPKRMTGPWWEPRPLDDVLTVVGADPGLPGASADIPARTVGRAAP